MLKKSWIFKWGFKCTDKIIEILRLFKNFKKSSLFI